VRPRRISSRAIAAPISPVPKMLTSVMCSPAFGVRS
jgi:hypothetical protein